MASTIELVLEEDTTKEDRTYTGSNQSEIFYDGTVQTNQYIDPSQMKNKKTINIIIISIFFIALLLVIKDIFKYGITPYDNCIFNSFKNS